MLPYVAGGGHNINYAEVVMDVMGLLLRDSSVEKGTELRHVNSK